MDLLRCVTSSRWWRRSCSGKHTTDVHKRSAYVELELLARSWGRCNRDGRSPKSRGVDDRRQRSGHYPYPQTLSSLYDCINKRVSIRHRMLWLRRINFQLTWYCGPRKKAESWRELFGFEYYRCSNVWICYDIYSIIFRDPYTAVTWEINVDVNMKARTYRPFSMPTHMVPCVESGMCSPTFKPISSSEKLIWKVSFSEGRLREWSSILASSSLDSSLSRSMAILSAPWRSVPLLLWSDSIGLAFPECRMSVFGLWRNCMIVTLSNWYTTVRLPSGTRACWFIWYNRTSTGTVLVLTLTQNTVHGMREFTKAAH